MVIFYCLMTLEAVQLWKIIILIIYLFKLQMGFYPVAVVI
jgi:hypothetical protein